MSLKITRIKNVSIHFDAFFLIVLIFTLFAGYFKVFVFCFICMALHESGHVLTAILVHARVRSIKIMPVGFSAVIDDDFCSVPQRAAISVGGPFANIVVFFILSAVNSYFLIDSENMRFFILTNLLLAVFNMIPVMPLDGGRLIWVALSGKIGLFAATNCTYKISIVFSLGIITAGLILLLDESCNFSLLCIGLYIFFFLKSGKTEAALMNVKHVIYRRSRLLKRGIYPARDLVVIKSVHLCEILNNIDFDRFHIIYVLDDDLKICSTFTEQQIIDNMLKYNADMTFEELISLDSSSKND